MKNLPGLTSLWRINCQNTGGAQGDGLPGCLPSSHLRINRVSRSPYSIIGEAVTTCIHCHLLFPGRRTLLGQRIYRSPRRSCRSDSLLIVNATPATRDKRRIQCTRAVLNAVQGVFLDWSFPLNAPSARPSDQSKRAEAEQQEKEGRWLRNHLLQGGCPSVTH